MNAGNQADVQDLNEDEFVQFLLKDWHQECKISRFSYTTSTHRHRVRGLQFLHHLTSTHRQQVRGLQFLHHLHTPALSQTQRPAVPTPPDLHTPALRQRPAVPTPPDRHTPASSQRPAVPTPPDLHTPALSQTQRPAVEHQQPRPPRLL